MRWIVVVALLAACQRKASPPGCDAVADHVLELMSPIDDLAKDVRDVFATRCREDAWSEQVRSCIGETRATSEPQNCKKHLTADQAKRLDTAIAAAQARDRGRHIPPVCGRYEQILAKALACDKLPGDLKISLRSKFEAARAGWATMPDKTDLGPQCSAAITALKQAAIDCGSSTW